MAFVLLALGFWLLMISHPTFTKKTKIKGEPKTKEDK